MPNNTNEKPIIEDGDCEVLCSVCSKPLGEAWSTCLCYPIHGKWHTNCDPHKADEEWWKDISWVNKMDLALENCSVGESDASLLELVDESRRRARLEMAMEMIDVANAHKNTIGAFAALVLRLTAIIQEEEGKV